MKRLASFLLIPIVLLAVGCRKDLAEDRVIEENYSQGNALKPKGALPNNFLDVTPNKDSHSLWQSVAGPYELGHHNTLRSLGPSCWVRQGKHYEGRYITLTNGGVIFEKKDRDVRANAKYFGAVFHEPYSGWCGSAGCNRGVSGHSLVYKLSLPINSDSCVDPMEYILIAFDAKKGRYNRIYLSNLRGVDDDQYKIDLDDLERNNFKSTHYYRQEPTVDWIKTVPGKTVCTHATSGNPDAGKEAKRRGLTTRDCQKSQVSDKGRMLDAPTFPGEVLYATIKKPVQVFAYDFFKLRPKDNL